jgi:ABC-type Fe3+ transport system permease subunit
MLDYIYYRIAKAYFKWDGELAATAIVIMSLLQSFFLLVISTTIIRRFVSRTDTAPYAKQIGGVGIVVFLVLCALNYFKYKGKYHLLSLRWKDENPTQRRLRGVMIIFIIPISIVLLVVIGNHL